MSIIYAKGHKPTEMDAAKGGLVLDRHQNFAKEENDDYHPLGTGLLGPENSQSYTKKKKDKLADRKGDTKSVKPVMPRC